MKFFLYLVYAFASSRFRKDFVNLICLRPTDIEATTHHTAQSFSHGFRR